MDSGKAGREIKRSLLFYIIVTVLWGKNKNRRIEEKLRGHRRNDGDREGRDLR